MTKRRWMKLVLNEAKKEPVEMPWARAKRATERAAKLSSTQAAE